MCRRSRFFLWKMSIMKAYELISETYQQKLRCTKKTEKQSYVESGTKEGMFYNQWCLSKVINQYYMWLLQLMLIEEPKNCLPADIKIYIDEQKIENLHQATTLADDYALTHKCLFDIVSQSSRENQRSTGDSHPALNFISQSNTKDHNEPTHQSLWFSSGPICFYCKKKGQVL